AFKRQDQKIAAFGSSYKGIRPPAQPFHFVCSFVARIGTLPPLFHPRTPPPASRNVPMGWFKDLLGTSNWQTAAPTSTGASGPLGMAQGKGVRFDTTLALLLEGSTSVRVPFDQAVWSAGWVDL